MSDFYDYLELVIFFSFAIVIINAPYNVLIGQNSAIEIWHIVVSAVLFDHAIMYFIDYLKKNMPYDSKGGENV